MQPIIKTVIASVLITSIYNKNANAQQPGIANPFGIEIGSPGSCDILHRNFGLPSVKYEGKTELPFISFEAKNPEKIIQNARSIGASCYGDAIITVAIIVNRTHVSDENLTKSLQALSKKYKNISGAEGDDLIMFGAANADIHFYAPSGTKWFSIMYFHNDIANIKSDSSDAIKRDHLKQWHNAL